MNVFENVAFPLRIKKMNKTDIDKKVSEALKHTSLTGLEKNFPRRLIWWTTTYSPCSCDSYKPKGNVT